MLEIGKEIKKNNINKNSLIFKKLLFLIARLENKNVNFNSNTEVD